MKNHRSIYEFIRNTIIYKWLKDPKNTEIIAKFAQLLLLVFLVGVITYATITINR